MMKKLGWLAVVSAALAPMIACAAPAGGEASLHWYKGDTHVHTVNSDGDSAPDQVVRWYREHGYQFLTITDHEYLTDVDGLNVLFASKDKFLVMPGEEVTQVMKSPAWQGYRLVHVNGIGLRRVVHAMGTPELGGVARLAPPGVTAAQSLTQSVSDVRAAGGLAQVNHPNAEWSIAPADFAGIGGRLLLEIRNPDSNDLGGVDDTGAVGLSTEELWDALLTEGKIVWGVGSDDAHGFRSFDNPKTAPGRAWIAVRARELSQDAIMAALAQGDFYASTGVTLDDYHGDTNEIDIAIHRERGPYDDLPLDTRFMTRFIGAKGKVLASVPGLAPRYRIRGDEGYVRAVITDSDGYQAWTQPVFLDGRLAASPSR